MRRGARLRLAAAASLLGALAAAGPALAQGGTPAVPQHGGATHLGVATCASATCHGAAAPVEGGTVLQNEYVTWSTQDKHANAQKVLGNEVSRRIARNLGLEDARTAKVCLDCHADNPPPARRGPEFQISDGVGCEGCHGGADGWIRVHTINDNENSHARNIAAGLYPTSDPKARATMCLSCHFGDDTKFVTHRIMGAGHPRLSFELDTFTAIEPAHFAVDDDYAQRKRVVEGVQVWAIGQGMALAQSLELVSDSKWGRTGLFPELSFFDCHACHKPMSAARWQERASLGLGPGVVRFNDANLIMLRAVTAVVSPPLGREVAERGRALHRASQGTQDQWRSAARALRETSLKAVEVLAEHRFGEGDLRGLLDTLVKDGGRGEFIDYVAAEQTTMAIGSILASMRQAGWLAEGEYAGVQRVMDEMYAAVDKDEQYRPTVHQGALRRLQAAAR